MVCNPCKTASREFCCNERLRTWHRNSAPSSQSRTLGTRGCSAGDKAAIPRLFLRQILPGRLFRIGKGRTRCFAGCEFRANSDSRYTASLSKKFRIASKKTVSSESVRTSLAPGTRVTIQSGPFEGMMGRVERELDDRKRVAIFLEALFHARVLIERRWIEAEAA